MSKGADRQTFIALCLTGDALLEDVDDFVDAWHESDTKIPIYAFLGMTEPEYASWIADPATLRSIVRARKIGASFEGEVRQQYSLAARSAKPAEVKKIDEWLRRTGRI